ncbi:hypothetical protein Tco_0719279 [Tanacetum coccineum]
MFKVLKSNQRNFARGNGAAGFGGMQNRAGNVNAGQGKPIKVVFTSILNSTLSASRFNDLSTAYNAVMNRVVELEYENSRLLRKIEHDDHDTMIKAFSKLEVAHVNLHLKQHLKENANNLKSKSPRDVLEFDVFFEHCYRDDQIQDNKNTIRNI